jgi:hypothetical protein
MITAGRYHRGVFKGQPDQVSQVRRAVGQHVRNTPVADDMVLIASELASNAVRHSRSRGEEFTVVWEVARHYVWIAVEDLGGPWRPPEPGGCHHGLQIVAALATQWGIEPTLEGCVVWARAEFPAAEDLMTRREVAYKFRVTSATVATWARRKPPVLAEVRNEQGRPRYRRADVEELYLSGFRGGRRHG